MTDFQNSNNFFLLIFQLYFINCSYDNLIFTSKQENRGSCLSSTIFSGAYACTNTLYEFWSNPRDFGARCYPTPNCLNEWYKIMFNVKRDIFALVVEHRGIPESDFVKEINITMNQLTKSYELNNFETNILFEKNFGKQIQEIIIKPISFVTDAATNVGYNFLGALTYEQSIKSSFYF